MNSVCTRASMRSGYRSGVALAGLALALALPAAARAQDAPADGSTAKDTDIVVTGTSLRKVAPAGAQQFTVSAEAIQATGAISTDQMLASVPQLNSFGNLQTVNSGGTQLTVNRINLRNLPQGVGGGSPTLVLLDGHRMVGAGVKQSYPDPDVIPPALIQRVDVLTDGGSAIYGSDAVGGVINFITKRNFDGIEAGVRQGFAKSYSSTDVNFTAGKSWSSGSVYVAYNFARHDPLFGADRSYIKNINYTTGLPSSPSCTPGNVTVAGTVYAVVGGTSLAQGNGNLCDRSQIGVYYPQETRHSVMAGFRQELGSSVEFELKAYYSNRSNTADGGAFAGTASVTSANPNYISIGGGSTATQSVGFDFGPLNGREVVTTKLWSYGITPTLTWKIGHDWQLKAYYNYGQSQTTANDPQFNNTLLGAGVTAGTINPYNIKASNAGAIAQVLNWTNYGIGKATLSNAKATLDGPLFRLPGGEVRIAIGGEYIKEKFAGVVLTDTIQNASAAAPIPASRNVKSAFAELNVPVISPENNIPVIYSLNLSAAERFDKYSDFGDNWAPSLGVTLKPVSWIALRARWNRAFQAPSLVQLSQAGSPQVSVTPGFFVNFVPALKNNLPGAPAFNGGPIVAIQGTLAPLQPQRARDYNLGIDISPPFVKGLDLHLTYFNINYTGQIGTPPLGFGTFYGVPTFVPLYVMLPSIAQVQTFLTNAGISATQITNTVANINAQGGAAYVIADVRSRNLGLNLVRGFDMGFDYRHDVSFGAVYASFSGSYTKLAQNAPDGVNFTVVPAGSGNTNQAGIDSPRFSFVAKVGASVGDNFRGQLTWNHRAGYKISTAAQLGQVSVGAFNTFDLFTSYDVKQQGLPPIALSLGITNIFDKAPPVYYGATSSTLGGYANGSTIGRTFQLGASVKF